MICLAARVALGIGDNPVHNRLAAGWQSAECFTPLAAISAFFGLSMLTLNQLSAERIIPPALDELRALLLLVVVVWSLYLSWRKSGQWTRQTWRRVMAVLLLAAGVSVVVGQWVMQHALVRLLFLGLFLRLNG